MLHKKYLVTFLLSVSLIAIELGWTRIFSAEFFYTFAFLILSLAVLGLGMGALTLRFFPKLQNFLGNFLLLTAILIVTGPILVFEIDLKFALLLTDWFMVFKLLVIIGLLSSSFFCGGIALAILFKKNHTEIARLYTSDLLGAGSGVVIAMLAMNMMGTPVTVVWSALPVILASVLVYRRWLKILPLILLIALIIWTPDIPDLLEVDRNEPAEVIYKHWDAMAKIKIYNYDDQYRRINIDNAANTGVNAFDGDWNLPDSLKFGFQIVEQLIRKFQSCEFLSLGAGGGQDVFQALQFGAARIHAVEVNRHINHLMTDGELAEFSGFIYRDPRVTVVSEDARAYVRRFRDRFDIIYSFSSNSYAALASGAFSLAENYIYTTEAFVDYWRSLSPDGFLLMEHHFYVPRLVSEALDALKSNGISNPEAHLAVFELPNMRRKMLLIGKQPLAGELIQNAFAGISPSDYEYARILYPAPDSLRENLINRIVHDGWQTWQDSVSIDISPATDDRPYIAQMGLWRNFDREKFARLRGFEDSLGFPLSKAIVLIIIGLVMLIILPLNLLPYFFQSGRMRAGAWLYFFAIGLAFMMAEITFIQKYTLFIGPSIYSIITILVTLLIFSGIGSWYAPKINIMIAFGGIMIWIFLDIFIFKDLIYALGYMEMPARIIITAVLIAPVGFLMGIPFPAGVLRIGSMVDWGFAVNGMASVLGSCLIVMITFSLGVGVAQLCVILTYLLAFILYLRNESWT